MRPLLFFFVFVLSSLAAQTSRDYHLHIQRGIDKILAGVDKNVHVGVEVVSLKSGMRLYEKNSHQLFTPASVSKLFTAGAALSVLGPEYRFETRILSDGHNLYLQGGGDPSFMLQDLEDMVLELRLRQMTEIKGNLVIDNLAFDSVAKGPGWMWDDINGFCYAPMNALSINHNVVSVWVKPADTVATAAKVFAYPKTGFIKIVNQVTTDDKESAVTVERLPNKNTIQVKGEVALKGSLQRFSVPVEKPHLYAASLMRQVLKKGGIELKGEVKVAETPLHAEVLCVKRSESLSTLVKTLLKDTDNLYADNLFKKMGQVKKGSPGTWMSGSQVVRDHLEDEAHLKASDLVLLDGCGLSRYNLVSPHQLVQYLEWVYKKCPYAPEFMAALSLAGRDGTLKRRFLEKPNFRGKTGTMSGVTALSGYVETAGGEPLAFSILINGFTGKVAKYRDEVEDPIVRLLASLEKD